MVLLRRWLACVLVLILSGAAEASVDKIRQKLAAIPSGSEVELKLNDGTRVRGRLVSVDGNDVRIDARVDPIPISAIKSVKRIRPEPQVWSPVWGFARTWKVAAITLGVILLVGIYVAKNTR